MQRQDCVDPKSLLLGRYFPTSQPAEGAREPDSGGMAPPAHIAAGGDVATLGGDRHLLTIAPAAAGRGRSCIIPNLLSYAGSVVVFDPTGDVYSITARARREMGHRVVRLDPFHVIEPDSDTLNPLDLLAGHEGPALESACQDIAALLHGSRSFTDVWENAAFGLLSGVIGYIATVPEKGKFGDIYSTFHADDAVYNLAVVLDTIGKQIPKMSYTEIASWLQKADAERSRVLSSVTSQLKALSSQEVQKTVDSSTFSLADFGEGKPMTVYVIVPPTKLPSHSSLLRVWVGTLLYCVMGRRVSPAVPTLFLLDECAKLGHFPQLEAAILPGGGSGFRVWTHWHDLQQLRSLYPASWLVGNCGAVQVFGVRDHSASGELAALLGAVPEDVRSLAADEQLVGCDGALTRLRLLDYLTDPWFAGRFDPRR